MGKIFNSFEDMGKALGFTRKQKEKAKRKCFRCGSEMHNIEGTNVFVCTGTTKGEKQCPNRLLS